MPLTFFCDEALPDVRGFSDCSPEFIFGEIEQILITPVTVGDDFDVGNHLNDWKSWEDWLSLIVSDPDEDVDDDGFYALQVPVRGTLGEPDRPELDASRYRKAYPPAEWNIECRVDDLPDRVYAALTSMHNTTVRMWFISGGYIFGGAEGLVVQMKTAPSIEEGRDSMHQYNVNAHYYGGAPERAKIEFGS